MRLLESSITSSLSDWVSPQNTQLPIVTLNQENCDLRNKVKSLENQILTLETHNLALEKQRLEREIALLTQIQQYQQSPPPSDPDPKDQLITALRHQVVVQRSDCKALEKKLNFALQLLPPDSVTHLMDNWDLKSIKKVDYSSLIKETYTDLSSEFTQFHLKSSLIRLLSALENSENHVRSLSFSNEMLKGKLDLVSNKAEKLENRVKQCFNVLDLSVKVNKRVFKTFLKEGSGKNMKFIRKIQVGRGKRQENLISPAVTGKIPTMAMTSPKFEEGDEGLMWKIRDLEVQLQVFDLKNRHLEDLLQEKMRENRNLSHKAEFSEWENSLEKVRGVYEAELLRREAQMQVLHKQLTEWVSGTMGQTRSVQSCQSKGDDSPLDMD